MKWLTFLGAIFCLAACNTGIRANGPPLEEIADSPVSINFVPQDVLECIRAPSEEPTNAADYVEQARLCLVVAPIGYHFEEELEAAYLISVNRERQAAGLPELSYRPELRDAARFHSITMAVSGFLGHYGPDGRRPHSRIQAFDRTLLFDQSRENLARILGAKASDNIVERLHEGLMDSPDHLENILAVNITHVAMGVVRHGGDVWLTQLFANKIGELSAPVPLRMSPREALGIRASLTGWKFAGFYAEKDGRRLPFREPDRYIARIPRDATGDIGLSVHGKKPGARFNSLAYIRLSGPLITIVD